MVSPRKTKTDNKKLKEKSLSELGFHVTEISNWNSILPPQEKTMCDLLKNMITNYEKTNVKILIDETIFNCHMMVLQCYSSFFQDKTLEQQITLPSDKVTPSAFVMIYSWMISPEQLVKRKGILEVFIAAQFLGIKGLVDQCWICLDDEERFSEDDAFLLYLEARTFGHDLIKQLMLARVCKFFLTLVASKEFLQLQPDEICSLLKSNSIGVNSETEVFMSAARWLHYDWENREKYLLDVIRCVRFGLMAPWQLVELGRNTDSPEIQKIIAVPDVKKMLEDGLSYVTTKYWSSNIEKFIHLMDKLNLVEPLDRQWVHDKNFSDKFHCPNQIIISYNSFLIYLEMIRNMGTEHWKSLTCHEENPIQFYQGANDHKDYDSIGIDNESKNSSHGSNRSSI